MKKFYSYTKKKAAAFFWLSFIFWFSYSIISFGVCYYLVYDALKGDMPDLGWSGTTILLYFLILPQLHWFGLKRSRCLCFGVTLLHLLISLCILWLAFSLLRDGESISTILVLLLFLLWHSILAYLMICYLKAPRVN